MSCYQIGFLGFGNMAQAIFKGADQAHFFADHSVFVSDPSESAQDSAQSEGIALCDTQRLFDECDIVVLGVKPQHISTILNPINCPENTHIVSILAGTSIQTLQDLLTPQNPITRVMPNTPALVKQGMSALSFNAHVHSDQQQWIQDLFNHVGKTVVVNEDQLNVITAVSGSGPAFMYQVINDIQTAALKHGLDPEVAVMLASQTMIGAGTMVQNSNHPISTLIQNVSSPGGTTVAGLDAMSQSSMSEDWQSIIDAATQRAIELGS